MSFMTSTQVYGLVYDIFRRVGVVEGLTIPTKTSQLVNDSSFVTSAGLLWSAINNKPTKLSDFTNDVGFITTAPDVSWANISGNPFPEVVSYSNLLATAPGNRLVYQSSSSRCALGVQNANDDYFYTSINGIGTASVNGASVAWKNPLSSLDRVLVIKGGRDMSPDGAGPEDVPYAINCVGNLLLENGYRVVGAGAIDVHSSRIENKSGFQSTLVIRRGTIALPSALSDGTATFAASAGQFISFGYDAFLYKPVPDGSANFYASGAALIVHDLGLAANYTVHLTLREARSGNWPNTAQYNTNASSYRTDPLVGGVISVTPELGLGYTGVISVSGVPVPVEGALTPLANNNADRVVPSGVVVWCPWRDANSFWVAAIGLTTNATRLYIDATIEGHRA